MDASVVVDVAWIGGVAHGEHVGRGQRNGPREYHCTKIAMEKLASASDLFQPRAFVLHRGQCWDLLVFGCEARTTIRAMVPESA